MCDLKRGTPLSSKDFVQSENAVIPVIAGGQKPAGYHSESNRPENCITVSCSGAYAGFLSYHKMPIFATDCFTITPKSEELLNVDYLYSLLKTQQAEIYGFQTGMGQPHVSPKDFVDFEIPLPSIEEQRAIVAEIEGYQKIIDAARTIADNYRPQITIDPSWQMVELGEVCLVRSGGTPSRNELRYWNGNIPWVGSAVCKDCKVNSADEYISEEGLSNSSAKLFKVGTTLIALVGATIGKTAYLEFETTTNQNIAGLFPIDENKLNKDYLFYVAQNLYKEFMLLGDGKFRMANLSFVRRLQIPLPDLKTQQQIVAEIEREQAAVDSAKELIEIFTQKITNRIAQIWNE